MQKSTTLTLAAFVMVMATLAFSNARRPMQGETRLLKIETFPKQVGAWHSVEEISQKPEVLAALPSAHILERVYEGPGGHKADVLLLTATDDQDFHEPTWCMPGQGWTITERKLVPLADQKANLMSVTQDNMSSQLTYYWVRCYNPDIPKPGTLLDRVYRMRRLFNHESYSLFVRIIMSGQLSERPTLVKFSEQVWRDVQPIVGAKASVDVRD